ncbi:MAG: 3-phosphoshikimate 1-carboxyvinyltransferase [Archaeoglobaceae archaeon]|nr:3-phosphoshikimate 1-carboxyvinyltransferase [Archaeoglobaceae archaeon]MDW8118602.1 3-phosphoshikimate 1-carboxyvinyltransferase [Archaeoglobaceae archaeon]
MDAVVRKSEVCGDLKAPPSKSYTHRAFISASLSKRSIVINPLISGDTLATLKACEKIGAGFSRRSYCFEFSGVDEIKGGGYFNFENSGTTLRIFTGLLSLCPEFSTLDGDASLRTRPNKDLVLALKKLGASAKGDELFRAPFRIKGAIKGGEVEIKAESSQFISSLLFSLSLAKGDSYLKIIATKSRPYIDLTTDVLEKAGVKVEKTEDGYFIPGEQNFNLRKFEVPADFSSASYLISAGIIAGEVRITNAFDSMQGDKKIVEICREMGADVRWDNEKGLIVAKKSNLSAISFDAGDTPDLVPAIAVLCAVANGVSEIYNAEHLRIKEIDRIAGICKNLRALGVEAEERKDGMRIKGGKKEFFGTVDSFGDHRMALAFSLLGLLGEVKCRNADAVSVSYPGFFDDLRKVGAKIEIY